MRGIQVDEITVEYDRGRHATRPLDRFCLTAAPGSLVLLIGPSGCGKTTLLSCLAGIQSPTAGRVTVDGTTITDLRGHDLTRYRQRGVGIVFQAFNLVPSLNAAENVMIPMRAAGVARHTASARAAMLLSRVGLGDRLRSKPGQLSGGQQQRVGIARALALDPPLLVADEPTAALDHTQVETILRTLRGLTDQGRTVIVSTHDQRLLGLADQVIDMVPPHSAAAHEPDRQHLDPGEVLFTQGSRGDRIYRVVAGEVELVDVALDGTETLLDVVGPGGDFGEMGAVFDLPRAATARARTAADIVGYTVSQFKNRFGARHLMSLIARYAPTTPAPPTGQPGHVAP